VRIPRRVSQGFTLIELVVVIVISGILVAYAASQINTKTFDALGFADQTVGMVRYAQKLAISQRRTVAVVFSGNSVSLCYTDTACSGGQVLQPPGMAAFQLTAPSGATLAGTTFSYNSLGQPSSGPITVTVSGPSFTRSVTVEADTGYVH
jgi:MSHA pilin protein MshC